MSDYMFMLESRLSADQKRVVGEFQAAASEGSAALVWSFTTARATGAPVASSRTAPAIEA